MSKLVAKAKAVCFETPEEMSAYQASREVQEALQVALMTPEERFIWLRESWGRLQRAGSIFAGKVPVEGTARCFATMEEKNRFDENREIELAMLRYKPTR